MMRFLTEHKTMNPLQFCDVETRDEPGAGGANHLYRVTACHAAPGEMAEEKDIYRLDIRFQDGPRNEHGSTVGVIDTALLAILIDRLQSFQSGPFSSREGAIALTHLQEALLWSDKRAVLSAARGVMGKNQK